MDMLQRKAVSGFSERINKMIIKCGIFCLNFLFAFLKLLPVQKKITYISRQMNTTPLDFQMVIDNIKLKEADYKHIVLAKMIPEHFVGKIGYLFHMLKQMYHIATSKAVILDTYCIPISLLKQRESLVVIQMWHALGAFKKFGYSILDQKEGSSSRIAKLMRMHKNYTYVLASSEYTAAFFAEAFQVEREQMRVFPLPKTDLLLEDELKEEIISSIYETYPRLKERKKKVIVYAPTFRKDDSQAVALQEAVSDLIQAIDFEKYELVLKPHILSNISIDHDMVIYDKKFTSLEFFHVADVIITDYSAVLFEAVMLNKPIYFYAFDYEKYMENRSFYIDFHTELPGKIVQNAKGLMKIVEEDVVDYEKIKCFREKMVEPCKRSYTDDFSDFLLNCMRSHNGEKQ